jgi:hypothetical protein
MPSTAFRDANSTTIAAATSLRTDLIILCFEGNGAARGTVITDVARDIVFALLAERFRFAIQDEE